MLKDHILEIVFQRGGIVPKLNFRKVRNLMETRLMLETNAAEMAASRAEPCEIDDLDRLYESGVLCAKDLDNLDAVVESNRDFHPQIARMTHNREVQTLLRSIMRGSSGLATLSCVPLSLVILNLCINRF